MHPTTVIELGILLMFVVSLSLLTFLVKKTKRKDAWTVIILIFIVSLSYYAMRPVLVEKQTLQAIQQLNEHLTKTYTNESWETFHTDDHELEKVKILHVIFDNEPLVVYEYTVSSNSVHQINFWSSDTRETAEDLIEKGINPQHVE